MQGSMRHHYDGFGSRFSGECCSPTERLHSEGLQQGVLKSCTPSWPVPTCPAACRERAFDALGGLGASAQLCVLFLFLSFLSVSFFVLERSKDLACISVHYTAAPYTYASGVLCFLRLVT